MVVRIRIFKTWGRAAIIALLPLIVVFLATAHAKTFNPKNGCLVALEFPYTQLVYTFSLGSKGIIYGLPICYIMKAKLFDIKSQNIISFIVPAVYLFIIILAYCFILQLYSYIPQLFRSIGSVSIPVILSIPYIWRSIELLRRKKTIS